MLTALGHQQVKGPLDHTPREQPVDPQGGVQGNTNPTQEPHPGRALRLRWAEAARLM